MGIFKKRGVITGALVFSLLIGQVAYAKAADIATANTTPVSNSLRLQDDFYNVINRDWLNTAKIETGQVSTSTFTEINKTLTEQKKEMIKGLLANEKNYSDIKIRFEESGNVYFCHKIILSKSKILKEMIESKDLIENGIIEERNKEEYH